ncbi:nucleoside/nucleotide kinase family protein [Pontibacter mangrovi]|uniref:Thymidylate kinase-like domain-containing protein n=1 Tax=Pontibacter mangrovi TaxID=2589816 RepID=A0A501VYM6_9BACT|nr:hypothetical protein [Pontibacter mangrovi]TPE42519.1 hypothetical protein FJM65_18125 [Pontibacter mangrovi]
MMTKPHPVTSMNACLQTLLSYLHKYKVRYFLLTDFEADFAAGDIDLFVQDNSKAQFEALLKDFGWYKRKEATYHRNHHFYYSPDLQVYLDVKYSLSFASGPDTCYTYTLEREALERAVLNSAGVYRPAGLDAMLLYAAHLAYKERGKLEPKHQAYLRQYLHQYRHELAGPGSNLQEALEQWLAYGSPSSTEKLQQIIAPYFVRHHRQMVRRNKLPKYGYGLKILFLGTDGAGKTTLIKAVEEKINFKAKCLYLGMGENGWTTPITKKLFHYRAGTGLLNKAFNLVKHLVLLPSEFLLRIAPVKSRSRFHVVLIDRFPGTVFVEKKPLSRLLYRAILPKPDLVFFLHASPEVLVQRKPQELTLERSQADLLKFRQVAERVSGGKYISIDTTSISVDEARDKILAEIYKNPKLHHNLLSISYN